MFVSYKIYDRSKYCMKREKTSSKTLWFQQDVRPKLKTVFHRKGDAGCCHCILSLFTLRAGVKQKGFKKANYFPCRVTVIRLRATTLPRIKRPPVQNRQVAGSLRNTIPTTAVKMTSLDMNTPPSQPRQ
jgi:hypothetical protein